MYRVPGYQSYIRHRKAGFFCGQTGNQIRTVDRHCQVIDVDGLMTSVGDSFVAEIYFWCYIAVRCEKMGERVRSGCGVSVIFRPAPSEHCENLGILFTPPPLPPTAMDRDRLRFIAAPMVGQSDLPFRVLARQNGATLAYTQMLMSSRLLSDQEYLETHLKDLSTVISGLENPVVAQLCGNDPETIVQAGRKLQNYCQGIGTSRLLRICDSFVNIPKMNRPQPWLPPRARARWSLRCLLTGAERLASRGIDRCECLLRIR
jgi:hypothetical protein